MGCLELLVAMQGTPGWQDRLWSFVVVVAALGTIAFVVFYWLPRLRAPRCPECGDFMTAVDRNLISNPYEDGDGQYHKGREEVVYRCSAGHELRQEQEFADSDPSWAGRNPKDVYGKEVFATWLENEATTGEKETFIADAARRMREEAREETEEESVEKDREG